jgi:hypothetical protein
LVVQALADWTTRRLDLGFWRADEALDHPSVERLVVELGDLHDAGTRARDRHARARDGMSDQAV